MTGLDPSTLIPSQRREILHALTSTGGQLLDELARQRLDAIEREAGAVALEPAGSPDRLVESIQPFIDEAGHLRYMREQLGVLASRCAGTSPG
jgi:hypothetical protein